MADPPERLPKKAEALLESFPVPEHDFEAQALAIEARLRDVLPGSTPALLLEAPFPDDPAELAASDAAKLAPAAAELAPALLEDSAPKVGIVDGERGVTEPGDVASTGGGGENAELVSLVGEANVDDAARTGDGSISSDVAPAAFGDAAKPADVAPLASPVAGSLPATPSGASHSAPVTATPPPSSRGGQSLAALARSVANKSPRPQSSNDIAKESLSVAAAARAHTDVIVERVRGSRPDSGPSPSSPPGAPISSRPSAPSVRGGALPLPPTAPSSRPSAPSSRSSVPPSRSSSPSASGFEPPTSQPPQRRDMRGPWLAVAGIGFAAAAAVAFIGLSRGPSSVPPVASEPSEATVARSQNRAPAAQAPADPAQVAPQAQVAPAPIGPRPGEDNAPAAVAASEKPSTAGKFDPRDAVAEASPPRAASPNAQPQRASGAPLPRATPIPASPPRPAPEAVVLEEAPTRSGSAGAHGSLRPASGSPSGGLPEKPSTGAVQAAIGSVMAPARACIAGTSAAAPAQVTFGSDGSVKSAKVTGPTAGSPAATCIEGALRRARVAPFAATAFSLGVWVRP